MLQRLHGVQQRARRLHNANRQLLVIMLVAVYRSGWERAGNGVRGGKGAFGELSLEGVGKPPQRRDGSDFSHGQSEAARTVAE